ncbi:hypothetical protein HN865_03235 [Candidatus Woesearchaeota archaeon]|jgi:hypothetical protein|nr:hypothetical protein [Candidatus Woesearchaeota archaeon]MBT7237846.1 hypothetical protein [Candidatus Woesearchaeota archaeon]
MKKEVSSRFVIILLVLAIVFSIGGTMIVYDSVKESSKDNVNYGAGFVTLEVVGEDEETIEEEKNEVFE